MLAGQHGAYWTTCQSKCSFIYGQLRISIDFCNNIISKVQMAEEFSLHPLGWFKGDFSLWWWVVGGKGHCHALENNLNSRITTPGSLIFPFIITRMAFTCRFLFPGLSQTPHRCLILIALPSGLRNHLYCVHETSHLG